MKYSIKIENVRKKFGNNVVLDDINFCIEKGMIMGLNGINGAGKTTLLRSIIGLLSVDSGEIQIEGYSVRREYKEAIKNVGFLLEPAFYEYLTAEENLKIVCMLCNIKANIIQDEIKEMLNFVGLYEKRKTKVKTFSFGMKQRLGLAQAMVNNPSVLILDEPMVGMDPIGMEQFKAMIRNLNKRDNTTILFSSHQLDEMQDLCTDVAMLKDKKIAYSRNMQDIVNICSKFEFEKVINADEQKLLQKIFLSRRIVIHDNRLEVYDGTEENTDFSLVSSLLPENRITNYKIEKTGLKDVFNGIEGE